MSVLTTANTSNATKTSQISVFDWLKPRRSVAITRLKNNGFALVVTLLVTQLAPVVPSPTTCLWMIVIGGQRMNGALRWLCWMELALYAVLCANIIQSYISLRYPPPPCEQLSSPAKRAQVLTPPPTRPLKGFSTNMKSSSASVFSSPVSTPSRAHRLPLSNSSPSPFQTSLNSSFSSSLLSSPLGYRSRQPHAQSVRSLGGSLLNQLEASDGDDF